jgi:ATP-binding cassette subfamily B protein
MPKEKAPSSHPIEVSRLLNRPLTYFMTKHLQPFAWGMFTLLLTNGLDALNPWVLGQAIDAFKHSQSGSAEASPSLSLWQWSLIYFAILASLAITRYLWRYFFSQYHTQAAESLRQLVFAKYLEQSPDWFYQQNVGERVSLLINDIQAYRQAIGHAILVTVDGLMISAFVLPMMWFLSPSWLFAVLLFVPFLPFIIRWVMREINHYFGLSQESLAKLSHFVQESISGIRLIKSFTIENQRLKDFEKWNQQLLGYQQKLAFFDSLFHPVMESAVALGSIVLVFLAQKDLLSGAVGVGTFIAYQRYVTKMVWPLTAMGMGLSQMQKGLAAFRRIRETLEQSPWQEDESQSSLSAFKSLSLEKVQFFFDSPLSGFKLQIDELSLRPKKKYALLGPVGCGKSLLGELLIGLKRPRAGKILYNDHDIESYSYQELRQKILLVTQEPILFSMSIRENLALVAPWAKEEDLVDLLKMVQIWDDIQSFENGLDTLIGERGVNLSGGQKQRLALARALLKRPEFLILDDPLSAVDIHTEEAIVQNLARLDMGLLIMTHRLNVVRFCDEVIIMHDGHLVERGTWQELSQKSDYFQKILLYQDGKSSCEPLATEKIILSLLDKESPECKTSESLP